MVEMGAHTLMMATMSTWTLSGELLDHPQTLKRAPRPLSNQQGSGKLALKAGLTEMLEPLPRNTSR